MIRHAFTMKLKPGNDAEYKRRHDAIWPELVEALRAAGISDYSIFLDEASGTLFAFQRRTEDNSARLLPQQDVMQRWWLAMRDLMETNPDNSPVESPLHEVFHME